MEKATSSIENLEIEAEKSLESANSRANEIIAEAAGESQRILSTPLSFDDVKTECREMVEKAKQESEEKVKESRLQAEEIRTGAEKKVEGIVNRLLKLVTGA